MKIGFIVNDVMTEQPGFTTVRLAHEAHQQGHEAYLMGVGDLAYDPDENIRARARCVPKDKKYKTHESYLTELHGKKGVTERITVDDLDVLMLRNVPSDDYINRPWAAGTAAEFGRVAMRRGVVVVNDPNGLAKASTKMYFQLFPEEVRPRTLITRDREEIKAFAKAEGRCVLKPMQGSGGASVFLVQKNDIPNLNQMIDAVSRDGFVICQEYLTAAEEGDMRLFVMNGRPLQVKGKYAAFRRVRGGGDMRSNIHAGGKLAPAEVTAKDLKIAEIVRPKLVQDGMFLVGLDIVGDKLMEINVFSPGGLGSAQKFTKINFNRYVVDALKRKVDYMGFYGRNFDNVDMCTL
ncbi:MAG: glutathione synthetase [Planctomycetota bacterium]|nr:glutathione synthetase [Planctomycetota bacterium]MDA1250779.1 glutathione synthetase [Planctomycetota bacterium]